MSGFANGKNAYGISDRSGFRYKLHRMKKEWNGSLVGPDEYEAKQPQLFPPPNVSDPQAIRNDWRTGERFAPVLTFLTDSPCKSSLGRCTWRSRGQQT